MELKYRVYVILKKRYVYLLVILLAALYLLYSYVLSRDAFFASNPYAAPFLTFLIFFACGTAYRLFISVVYSKFKSILYARCDPGEYLRVCRYIIHNMRKKGRPQHFSHFLDYSAGLIAAGRFSDALDVLAKVGGFGTGRKGLSGTVAYFDQICEASLGAGKTDKAREAYKNLEKSYAALNPGADMSGSARYFSKSVLIKMAQGNYKGAEKFFSGMYEKARNNLERAYAKFRLGEVYLHNGDARRAREAFGYVAENGNKLYIADLARERLLNLD